MANNGSAIKANPGALSLLWFQTRMPECSSTPLLPSEPPEHSKWQESSSPKQCIFHAGNRPWLDDSSRQGRTSFHHLLQRQLETRAETAILRQPCLTVLVTLMDKTRAGMGRGRCREVAAKWVLILEQHLSTGPKLLESKNFMTKPINFIASFCPRDKSAAIWQISMKSCLKQNSTLWSYSHPSHSQILSTWCHTIALAKSLTNNRAQTEIEKPCSHCIQTLQISLKSSRDALSSIRARRPTLSILVLFSTTQGAKQSTQSQPWCNT